MTLSFPNASRSYDARRHVIRFWGYDDALEIAFFLDADVLASLVPRASLDEEGCLSAFDAARERIHEVARRAYTRADKGVYFLVGSDFR